MLPYIVLVFAELIVCVLLTIIIIPICGLAFSDELKEFIIKAIEMSQPNNAKTERIVADIESAVRAVLISVWLFCVITTGLYVFSYECFFLHIFGGFHLS